MRSSHKILQGLLSVALVVAIVGILARPAAAQSEVDEAQKIYELARALHTDDIKQQNYTYWVNGNIGEDIGLPALIVTIGEAMPDFNFKAMDDSDPLDSTKLEGPYLLNFWASWCGPCRQEFPLLLEASKDEKWTLPIYFVDTLDEKTEALAFLKQVGADKTTYTDSADSKFTKLNLQQAVPQTFLIDAKGNIQALHVGNMSPDSVRFFAEIAAHPGVGAFDASDPDHLPPEPTAAATSEPTAAATKAK